jgi:hypothetical protein
LRKLPSYSLYALDLDKLYTLKVELTSIESFPAIESFLRMINCPLKDLQIGLENPNNELLSEKTLQALTEIVKLNKT